MTHGSRCMRGPPVGGSGACSFASPSLVGSVRYLWVVKTRSRGHPIPASPPLTTPPLPQSSASTCRGPNPWGMPQWRVGAGAGWRHEDEGGPASAASRPPRRSGTATCGGPGRSAGALNLWRLEPRGAALSLVHILGAGFLELGCCLHFSHVLPSLLPT